MDTPICDFIKEYNKKAPVRFHMPGHKGENFLGLEHLDITEITGADSLLEANGIIKKSEENLSSLFSCHSFYSCEGSSVSIRAMMYLLKMYNMEHNLPNTIIASRNAHKSFLSAVALLDFDVIWLNDRENNNLLSSNITPQLLSQFLENSQEQASAVYITSPDYLGNIADLCTIAHICSKHNILLLADNAHGAYLNFLDEKLHPMQLGAHMCCDSAHKTLPVLTGGGYLHISNNAPDIFKENAKRAMELFCSTSPSYLILQSLDMCNKYLCTYSDELKFFVKKVNKLKEKLKNNGYSLLGNEPLKITLDIKKYGFTGIEFAKIIEKQNIIIEYCDKDYVVFMLSTQNSDNDLILLEKALLSIKKRDVRLPDTPKIEIPKKYCSANEALNSLGEEVLVKNALGRVCAQISVACPPAIPIVALGEIIDEKAIKALEYYDVKTIRVIKTKK